MIDKKDFRVGDIVKVKSRREFSKIWRRIHGRDIDPQIYNDIFGDNTAHYRIRKNGILIFLELAKGKNPYCIKAGGIWERSCYLDLVSPNCRNY